MEQQINTIVQQLFHQPALESVAMETLLRVSKQHPSFATAHFLLLKKMQQEAHPDFLKQLQQTNLYFHNPLWLHYLLQDKHNTAEEQPVTAPVYELPELPGEINDAPVQEPAAIVNEPAIAVPEENIAATTTIEEPAVMHTPATTEQPVLETPIATPAAAPIAETSITETVEEELTPPATPEEYAAAEAEANDTGNEPDTQITNVALAEMMDKEKEAAEAPAGDALLLQPYHTVDYFAALGIKLNKNDDGRPQTKFDQQLKSFTEWLKSMKKLPQPVVEKELAQNDETEIIKDAAQSVKEKEIITEAMAEVLEKQGLNEIAIRVYEKLSLQNPSKSAYFAAKIESLKN